MQILVIDIGGTGIKSAIVDCLGNINDKKTYPTPDSFNGIINYIQKLIDKSNYDAVSICVPGVYDKVNDFVIFTPNTSLSGNKLKSLLKTNKPVFIENDANFAAFGEYGFAFDDKPDTMVAVTLGTGVGGGIVFKGDVVSDKITVTELGHITISAEGRLCGCGKKGCLEPYCNTSGLLKNYEEISGNKIKVFELVALADKNDPSALKAFNKYSIYLAHGLVSIINLFTPDVICIGGGLSELSRFYLDDCLEYLNKITFPAFRGKTEVKIAKFKNDAALLGGYIIAEKYLKKTN